MLQTLIGLSGVALTILGFAVRGIFAISCESKKLGRQNAEISAAMNNLVVVTQDIKAALKTQDCRLQDTENWLIKNTDFVVRTTR